MNVYVNGYSNIDKIKYNNKLEAYEQMNFMYTDHKKWL